MGKYDFEARNAAIHIFRKEVLHDVAQEAWTEGDMLPDDAGHAKHLTQDITEHGQIDRTSRTMNLAYFECAELMYPYTKTEIDKHEELVLDNKLEEPDIYVFQLQNLPDTFSITSVFLLEKLLHEYFVCRVLQDRLDITKKESANSWQGKLELIKGKIKKTLCCRMKRVRRTISPF